MKTINCLGEICPIPIMLLQRELAQIRNGSPVQLITDHSCSFTAVTEFSKTHHLYCTVEEPIAGVWELIISNTPCLE